MQCEYTITLEEGVCGGSRISQMRCQPIIFFKKKFIKMKKNWTEREACFPDTPLDPQIVISRDSDITVPYFFAQIGFGTDRARLVPHYTKVSLPRVRWLQHLTHNAMGWGGGGGGEVTTQYTNSLFIYSLNGTST